jgi:dTDP-4-dehydrorhamnose reductase
MRIMVMGATGMLGNQLLRDLEISGHEMVGTVRNNAAPGLDRYGISAPVLTGVDALSTASVREALHTIAPDVVINCIGFVKQLEAPQTRDIEIELNARFPHRLARLCSDLGCRLIHVSTDCVFVGNRSMYQETDPVDATDLYGRSKAAGEVSNVDGCLTIRTSIIGHELASSNGLLEWFLRQEGTVHGRSRAIFNGFPTTVLARVIDSCILPDRNMSGLYHVSSEPISKFELLQLLKQHYGTAVVIERDDHYAIDRTLNSQRFRRRTGFRPDSWESMIAEMAQSAAISRTSL